MSETGETKSRTLQDRVAGAVLLTLAVLIALEAQTFTVGFVTDPLGPKAFPLVSAFLFLSGGVVLLIRPGSGSRLPTAQQIARCAAAAVCLFAYATLLGFLGFFTTTLLVVGAFSILLGGRPRLSFLSALIISALLYGLFAYVLEIALPLGSLFVRGG